MSTKTRLRYIPLTDLKVGQTAYFRIAKPSPRTKRSWFCMKVTAIRVNKDGFNLTRLTGSSHKGQYVEVDIRTRRGKKYIWVVV